MAKIVRLTPPKREEAREETKARLARIGSDAEAYQLVIDAATYLQWEIVMVSDASEQQLKGVILGTIEFCDSAEFEGEAVH